VGAGREILFSPAGPAETRVPDDTMTRRPVLRLLGIAMVAAPLIAGCSRNGPTGWVTSYENESHALYRRAGHGKLFNHSTARYGPAATGAAYVGFGTAFVDVDRYHRLEQGAGRAR
jgi:hypothetical protein